MSTAGSRSTGAIMTDGKNKKFREMTLEERIIYYQNKASLLKKKQELKRAERHMNVGRIFEKVFGEVTGTDQEIEYVFTNMMRIISDHQKSRKQNTVPEISESNNSQSTTSSNINSAPAAAAATAPQGPIKD